MDGGDLAGVDLGQSGQGGVLLGPGCHLEGGDDLFVLDVGGGQLGPHRGGLGHGGLHLAPGGGQLGAERLDPFPRPVGGPARLLGLFGGDAGGSLGPGPPLIGAPSL